MKRSIIILMVLLSGLTFAQKKFSFEFTIIPNNITECEAQKVESRIIDAIKNYDKADYNFKMNPVMVFTITSDLTLKQMSDLVSELKEICKDYNTVLQTKTPEQPEQVIYKNPYWSNCGNNVTLTGNINE